MILFCWISETTSSSSASPPSRSGVSATAVKNAEPSFCWGGALTRARGLGAARFVSGSFGVATAEDESLECGVDGFFGEWGEGLWRIAFCGCSFMPTADGTISSGGDGDVTDLGEDNDKALTR
mmetsp:Transcript_40200/g.67361  ORF Transcript_40200/g.67361 Transcript_40200/m.67361 type:complete len:123 (-) Transcript_40200:466-834(-)